MNTETKAVASRFYEIITAHDTSRLEEVCSPQMRGHAGTGADLREFRASTDGFIAAFPDLVIHVRHLVQEGDTVSTWVTYEGTHQGEFAGVPASGRPVRFAAWDLMRIEDGRIVELTEYCDLFALMQQIGALPMATPV
jgi:steroid delta-isomerase-like uncharacterized protein